jgi:hypothetical protein
VSPVVATALVRAPSEATPDWSSAVSFLIDDRDPRRYAPYLSVSRFLSFCVLTAVGQSGMAGRHVVYRCVCAGARGGHCPSSQVRRQCCHAHDLALVGSLRCVFLSLSSLFLLSLCDETYAWSDVWTEALRALVLPHLAHPFKQVRVKIARALAAVSAPSPSDTCARCAVL